VALLGIAVTAALTWSISQLAGQRIGLSSEPLSMIHGLAPPHPEGRPSTTRGRLPSFPNTAVTSSTPRSAALPARAAAPPAASGALPAVQSAPDPVAPSVLPGAHAGGQSSFGGGSPSLSGSDHQDDSGATSGRPRPQRDD